LSIRDLDTLIAELQASPALHGKRVEVVTIAVGGYKQPQQLLALTYMLTLGASFDVIVNLDGFNEVALPPVENIPAGTSPFYPRSWQLLTADRTDLATLSAIGRLAAARDDRRAAALRMSGSWLHWSITADTIWLLVDRVRQQTIARLEQSVETAGLRKWRSFAHNGPASTYDTPRQMYADLAAVWERASLQMARLAQSNGIRYFHFLQPNQYDLNSKPLTSEERRVAFNEHSPYKVHIEAGYDELRQAGRRLTAAGVSFHDLSRMFVGERRTIYADDCCHLNHEGYQLLARAIARTVLEGL
jgi:hypothetical protein